MKIKLLTLILTPWIFITACEKQPRYAIIISADSEWKSVKKHYQDEICSKSVWGEYFFKKISNQPVLFFHEGWGKVSAAGATQYVIDKYDPEFLINLGTCGGFKHRINRSDVILANRTIIYDIVESMGDSKEAIDYYSTQSDLTWLGENYPVKVRVTGLVSADRDLQITEIDSLEKKYGAVAGDWESGAIAFVAKRNNKKTLILRGVTDLVNNQSGEVYGNFDLFAQRTDSIMLNLLNDLPKWIEQIEKNNKK
jgi:adenosylhomocysteine nucleosidase